MKTQFYDPKHKLVVELPLLDLPRNEFVPEMPTMGTEIELFFRNSNMAPAPEAAAIHEDPAFKDKVSREAATSMIEFMTSPHATLEDLRADHAGLMKQAVAWATQRGMNILPLSCEPLQMTLPPNWAWEFMQTNLVPKYGRGPIKVFGVVASVQYNMGIGEGNALLYAHECWRRFMPALLAITTSSPFHGGLPTGLLSMRYLMKGLMFNGGHLPEAIDPSIGWKEYFRRKVALTELGKMFLVPWSHNLPIRLRPERGCLELAVPDLVADIDQYTALADFTRRMTFRMLQDYAEGRPIPTWLGNTDDLALHMTIAHAARDGRHGKMVDGDFQVQQIRDVVEQALRWAKEVPEDGTHDWALSEGTIVEILDHGTPAEGMMDAFHEVHPNCVDPDNGCDGCRSAVQDICAEVSKEFHAQFVPNVHEEFGEQPSEQSATLEAGGK